MPNAPEPFALLRSLNSPADLRAQPENRLGEICDELRDYLIKSVATRGGHFAAGLGTVELTVALHYVFETPRDRLVWDVGHQAYPHKVLTGRRDRLDTIKQNGGLAPFPTRAESEYDTFGVGHSSTSISAALGMAVAAELAKDDRKVVAIIGDGAMTAGMAWEALFNAGARKTNLLVVLNDNDMSISENVGALSNYFAKVLSGRMYSTLRSGGKKILKQMPTMWELARRSEEMMKGMVLPGTLFEEFGFNFIGPDQRPRHQGAGHEPAQHAQPRRAAAAARGHQEGQGLRPGGEGSDQVARPGSVRSGQRHHLQGKGHRPHLLAGVRPVAVRHGRSAIHASSASRPPCAKARAWSNTRRNFRSVISTSPSPNSMPSRSRPASPARAGSPWSLSTPRSCSAPTTS